MKSITSNLQSELEAGKLAYIIKVILANGTSFGYTNHDRPLTIDSFTYQPGAGLSRVKLTATANAEVSNQDVESSWTVDINEQDALNGLYDEAVVIFSWVSWEHPEYGSLEIFRGNIANLSWTDVGFRAEIHNAVRRLNNPIGSIVTPYCRHQLGDTNDTNKATPGGCNVNLASYTFTGSVSSILTDRRKFVFTGLASAQADGYFSTGVLTFTSGLNNNRIVDVKVHTVDSYGSQVEFYTPTSYVISPGDTFSVVAGCDRSNTTCKDKFNNVVNFGGFPHLSVDAV